MFLLVPAHAGSPGQRAVKQLCARACVHVCCSDLVFSSGKVECLL